MAFYCIADKAEIFTNLARANLNPKIRSVKNIKFNDKPDASIYTLDFYCPVDQREIIKNKVVKIEMFLSKNNISWYRQQYTPFDSLEGSKNQTDVNDLIYDYGFIMHDLIEANKTGLYKLAGFDPFQRMRAKMKSSPFKLMKQTDKQLFGERKEYKLQRKRKNTRRSSTGGRGLLFATESIPDLPEIPGGFEKRFRREYIRSVKSGIDPMIYLQESDNFVSVEEMAKGVSRIVKPRKSRLRRFFKSYVKVAAEHPNDLDFEIVEKTISNRKARLKSMKRMNSVLLLGLLSRGFTNVILFAYDNKGNRVDSFGFEIDSQDMFDDFLNPIMEFDLFASRNRRGNINTKVTNDEFNRGAFNLYQKIINHNQPMTHSNFVNASRSNMIRPRDTLNFINGKKFKNQGAGSINNAKSVFQRVTFNFLGSEIANTKASSVRARVRPAKQINCKVLARCQPESNRISVKVYDFSEDVSSFQIVKRRVKGNRSNNFKPVKQKDGHLLTDHAREFFKSNRERRKGKVFFDEDVEDDVTYEYGVVLYDMSGAKHMSANRFFEEHTINENLVDVKIRPIQGALTNTTNDVKTTMVDQRFEVILYKKEDDIEKVLNSLFGDNRSLFSEDLKAIKEGSNLLYGARVHRLDISTGESYHVGTFRGHKQTSKNESENTDIPKVYRFFFNDNIPAYSKHVYKVEPYIIPPSQVLDKIGEKIKNEVAKNPRSRSTLNRLLASKMKILDARKISKLGGKYGYAKRQKGQISSQKSQVEISGGDLFLEGYTGDIHYRNFRSMTDIPSFDEFVVSDSSITQFSALDRTHRESKFISKNFIKVEFSAGALDHLVDFYVILRSENNKPTPVVDGVVHSKDLSTSKNSSAGSYVYLSETKTRVGYIKYYIVAVSKIGQLTGLLTLGDIYLRN